MTGRNTTTTQPHCQACQQKIIFIRMTATGKGLPCDPYPVADGNVCAMASGRGLTGYVVSKEHPPEPGYKRYAAHFGTCPERPRPGQPAKKAKWPGMEPPAILPIGDIP